MIEDKQVWVGAVGQGPRGGTLEAVYRSVETLQFQDELGDLVLRVCQVKQQFFLFLNLFSTQNILRICFSVSCTGLRLSVGLVTKIYATNQSITGKYKIK